MIRPPRRGHPPSRAAPSPARRPAGSRGPAAACDRLSGERTAHLPVCCSHIRRDSRSSLCASADPIAWIGTARSAPTHRGGGGARVEPTLRQACSRPRPRAQFAFKDSMIHIICNSHYVSHFAAFFIDTGAKISVVESCLWFLWRRWAPEGPARTKASDFECHGSVGVVPSRRPTGVVGRAPSRGRRPHPSDRLRPCPDRRTDRGAGARSSGSRLFRTVDQRPKTSSTGHTSRARGDGRSRGKVVRSMQ